MPSLNIINGKIENRSCSLFYNLLISLYSRCEVPNMNSRTKEMMEKKDGQNGELEAKNSIPS
jgi:hypothetical protein